MIIISWDVGVIHLAYCILEYIFTPTGHTINILDWDEINLIDNDRIQLNCCGKLKTDTAECGKKATYYLNINGKLYGFCKTHLPQHQEYWSKDDTQKLFRRLKPGLNKLCTHAKSDGELCGKKSTYAYQNNDINHCYCTAHSRSELKKKLKEYSPQPIKNMMVKKYPTAQLQANLVNKLDELANHFALLGIEEVVIENQPSQKNPKMKSIANTLFDYFLIRGQIDKSHGFDIKLVRFMCPSNKLKVNKDNTIEVFKANKDSGKKYKLTKTLGITYTKQLVDAQQLEYLELYKKKDDICDAYLQGRYYLEFIRKPDKINVDCKPIPVNTVPLDHKLTITESGNKSTKTSGSKKTGRKKPTIIIL